MSARTFSAKRTMQQNWMNLCEWKQLLLCLDEESRKIVELYYFDEFSVKEISALLEMNSNTVSTKLSRARAKLKKVIRR